MQLNLVHPETWAQLNQKIHTEWGLAPEVSVRVYKGVHHAAYELAVGTALFMSHKRSAGFIQGQTPAFQTVLPFLYKEAFNLQLRSQLPSSTQSTVQSQMSPNLSLVDWAKGLKSDTTFVMQAEDNPITGEYFDNLDAEKILNERKIFSIRVSHQRHLSPSAGNEWGITPSSVQICEINPHLAVALCGSRFKSPVQISAHMEWDEQQVLQELKLSKPLQRPSLQELKWNLPGEFKLLRASMDRVLIYHPDVHGEALEKQLKSRWGLSESSEQVMSVNSCRLGFLDLSWWETKPGPEILRDLVILNREALSRGDLPQALLESARACQI